MFRSLFNRRGISQQKLRPDDVRRLVREFLDQWPPFRDQYAQAGDIDVEQLTDRDGHGTWTANVIPAIDTRCTVIVDDAAAQVTEARVIAMRQRAVVAQWQRRAPEPGAVQRDR